MNQLLADLSSQDFNHCVFKAGRPLSYSLGNRDAQKPEQLVRAIEKLTKKIPKLDAVGVGHLVTVCHNFHPICTTPKQKRVWLCLHAAMIPAAWEAGIDPRVHQTALAIFSDLSWVADCTVTFSDDNTGMRVPLALVRQVTGIQSAGRIPLTRKVFQAYLSALCTGEGVSLAGDVKKALLEGTKIPKCSLPISLDLNGVFQNEVLPQNRFNHDSLKKLAGLPIMTLDLSENLCLQEADYAALKGVSSTLTSLKLRGFQASTPDLNFLAELTALRQLDLSGTRISFNTLTLNGLRSLQLEELKLNGCPLAEEAVDVLCALPLKKLEIEGVFLSEKSKEKLKNML